MPDRAGAILAAARSLGARAGVGALSLQAIAHEAGVSKALLLYHFAGKAALVAALVDALGLAGAAGADRIIRAAHVPGAMERWRALLLDPTARGEAALLNALLLEGDADRAVVRRVQEAREKAATTLALAVLADLGLAPRVPPPALGRLLLRQLDGLAATAPRDGMDRAALEAELDTFALALIGLAR